MSAQIGEEIKLLFISVYVGLVFIVSYDMIRIFRRIFPASVFRSIVEDILFWSAASIYLFQIFLKYNFGRSRYYSVIMAACTMLLYEFFIGRHFVLWASKYIKKLFIILLKPLKKIFIILLKPLKKIINRFKLLIKKMKLMKKKIHIRKRGINDITTQTGR